MSGQICARHFVALYKATTPEIEMVRSEGGMGIATALFVQSDLSKGLKKGSAKAANLID